MQNNNQKRYYQMFFCFMLGCILTTLSIWGYSSWSKSSHLKNYYIDAEIIEIDDNILTVKGLTSNPDYSKGTYYIKINEKISITDWVTENNLEWGVLNNYKYVTLLYTGRENNIKDKNYLKNVSQIFCNADERKVFPKDMK